MPTWLTGIQQQSWDTSGGSFTGGPPKGILHTTETSGWPGYDSGRTAPHLTVRPDPATKRLDVRQHIPLDHAARALVNKADGVQTNRDSAIQIELVGSCNPAWRTKTGYYYWPTAEPWALVALATLMRRLEAECGIKRTAVSTFKAYPGSYGTSNGVRLTFSQWDAFSGWLGHQHVPENTHGDPGNLNIGALMGSTPLTPHVPVVRPPVTPTAPKYPLPVTDSYGPRGRSRHVHSGHNSATDRANIRVWQAQMRKRGWTIMVDGFFGPQSFAVATQFQRNKRLTPNGLVGPQTWSATWKLPTT